MPVQNLSQFPFLQEFDDALVLRSEKWGQGRFGGMGERPVADIMQESSRPYQQPIFLFQAKMIGEERGHMVGPQAVLESGVIGAGVDQACQAELLYPAQPLHLGRVCQLQCQAFQQNIAVHRISDLGHWLGFWIPALKICGLGRFLAFFLIRTRSHQSYLFQFTILAMGI